MRLCFAYYINIVSILHWLPGEVRGFMGIMSEKGVSLRNIAWEKGDRFL